MYSSKFIWPIHEAKLRGFKVNRSIEPDQALLKFNFELKKRDHFFFFFDNLKCCFNEK
jgi:hypothetical protein